MTGQARRSAAIVDTAPQRRLLWRYPIVLGGSVLYIASLTIFPEILTNTTTPYPQRLLPLASPVVEIAIATVAALLYWRAAPADRMSLGLAAIGFTLYAVSATALAVET